MELTPLDIRNQKFGAKKLGGLDPDEVQIFLNQVAASFEQLLDERADLLKTINNDKRTVDDYRKTEKLLNDALITMQSVLNDTKARADKEAELIIVEAKAKAEREVDAIRSRANDLRSEIEQLRQIRTGYFARLRALMRSQEDLLNDMESENGI